MTFARIERCPERSTQPPRTNETLGRQDREKQRGSGRGLSREEFATVGVETADKTQPGKRPGGYRVYREGRTSLEAKTNFLARSRTTLSDSLDRTSSGVSRVEKGLRKRRGTDEERKGKEKEKKSAEGKRGGDLMRYQCNFCCGAARPERS